MQQTPNLQTLHKIRVNPLQKKNTSILDHLKNFEFSAGLLPDFAVGEANCVLYLSLQYFRLYPEYIFTRFRDLRDASWKLRVLLVLVDVQNPNANLLEISKLCLSNKMTLVRHSLVGS